MTTTATERGTASKSMLDLNQIIAYENGELDAAGTLALYGALIASGLAWTLQGRYGRSACDFIEAGYLTPDGEITDEGQDFIIDNSEEN